jgi:hypothetical protein
MIRYINGYLINEETGEVIEDLVLYELIDLQLDYYNNHSH